MKDRTIPARGVNTPAHPDVLRIWTWIRAHSSIVNDSPFWREFCGLPDGYSRLLYLVAFAGRRPSDPLICPRPGRTLDAHRQRAAIVVAYLRGRFEAPNLDAVSHVWTWQEICDYAHTCDAKGWESWRDASRAPQRFRELERIDAFRVVPMPPEAKALIEGIAAPVQLREIGRFVVSPVDA